VTSNGFKLIKLVVCDEKGGFQSCGHWRAGGGGGGEGGGTQPVGGTGFPDSLSTAMVCYLPFQV
jgi:hypothetical protein